MQSAIALVSGGKDSTYNMMMFKKKYPHLTIVALANLYPPTNQEEDMSSYMYQTVGHEMLTLYSKAINIPLFRAPIKGCVKNTDMYYEENAEDEVEDLYHLLYNIKKQYPSTKYVLAGAIKSNYQKIRVENVCERLDMEPLCFLWDLDQKKLLGDMIESNVESIIIKTSCIGLDEGMLRKTIQEMYPTLLKMNEKYGINICGEGGEYETFTLDCPLFEKQRIQVYFMFNLFFHLKFSQEYTVKSDPECELNKWLYVKRARLVNKY